MVIRWKTEIARKIPFLWLKHKSLLQELEFLCVRNSLGDISFEILIQHGRGWAHKLPSVFHSLTSPERWNYFSTPISTFHFQDPFSRIPSPNLSALNFTTFKTWICMETNQTQRSDQLNLSQEISSANNKFEVN